MFNSAVKALYVWLLLAAICSGDAIEDVTFSTKYADGEPTTAEFYYNGRAIGRGRDAFRAIVERVGALSPGASIVWGPNYDRCGACSGTEPGCVPKFLYPDLWKQLEALAAERRLTLSSDYPGPWLKPVGPGGPSGMPEVVTVTAAADRNFDAVLDWSIGAPAVDRSETEGDSVSRRLDATQFSSGGAGLNDFDLELLLGRLPKAGRVLVRVGANRNNDSPTEPGSLKGLAENFRVTWEAELAYAVRCGALKVTLALPADLAEVMRKALQSQPILIDWRNYRGPQTPHEEVLYLMNGEYVGRGDVGFDRILARVRELPLGSDIDLPRYEYAGRRATESFSPEEIDAKNAILRDLVPFVEIRNEFDAETRKRSHKVSFSSRQPPHRDSRTVIDWGSGDRYGATFVSWGRIVRHDERPRRAAARLAWAQYDAGNRSEDGNRRPREAESTAIYTVNDVELGQGVAGFAQAMDKFMALPEGSVVQVRVCLRTKGPFVCPLIFEGHRHFERTGFEPYLGLYPWLIDVARKRKLEIEWVPDEQMSYRDCELNL